MLGRVMDHLNHHNLLPEHQSAYRQHHSTETAVLRVSSDLLSVAGAGQMSLLVLDLSAAFDTVDHDILLRLETSSSTSVTCGVPRLRSGPLLFTICTADVESNIRASYVTWTPMPYVC